jgi:hypothetical protein
MADRIPAVLVRHLTIRDLEQGLIDASARVTNQASVTFATATPGDGPRVMDVSANDRIVQLLSGPAAPGTKDSRRAQSIYLMVAFGFLIGVAGLAAVMYRVLR